MNLKKGEILLIIFNLAYLVIFAIYYLSIKNYEFLWYIFIVFVLLLILGLTLRRSNLDYVALWGLSIWGLLHMLGGGLIVKGAALYRLHIIEIINRGGDFYILKMDQVIHFYGFAVAAIVIFQLVYPRFKNNVGAAFLIFIAWIGSMGLGAINEVAEFLAFVILSETGVGDIYNTGFDLIFNLLGALAGAVLAYNLRKK